jgi:hypothetical protein
MIGETVECHAVLFVRKPLRFCSQPSQATTCESRVFGFELELDLLAADFEKCEICPVSVPIKTFSNLGESLRAFLMQLTLSDYKITLQAQFLTRQGDISL